MRARLPSSALPTSLGEGLGEGSVEGSGEGLDGGSARVWGLVARVWGFCKSRAIGNSAPLLLTLGTSEDIVRTQSVQDVGPAVPPPGHRIPPAPCSPCPVRIACDEGSSSRMANARIMGCLSSHGR